MTNVDVGHRVFVVTSARPIIGKVISWDHRDPNFKVYTIKTIKGQIHKVKEYPYTSLRSAKETADWLNEDCRKPAEIIKIKVKFNLEFEKVDTEE